MNASLSNFSDHIITQLELESRNEKYTPVHTVAADNSETSIMENNQRSISKKSLAIKKKKTKQ